jgi:hypothetical protein
LPGWRQFGSGIRDGKKSDPGSGINIPDPQYCFFLKNGSAALSLLKKIATAFSAGKALF